MATHRFSLFADYFQFYLSDEQLQGDLSDAWTDEAVAQLLALAPGVVGVGTARNLDVPVEIELVDGPPDNDLAGWDRVNECTLDVPSGRIGRPPRDPHPCYCPELSPRATTSSSS